MTPDEFTNQELMLDVGDGHQLYVHDWGSTEAAKAILFVHGGPGNGCDDADKSKFDPKTQRVIFYDQRGAGKSTPSGSLQNNTTSDLVKDIDKIRVKFELDKIVLVGGSWGSTLSLAYAISRPDNIEGLVLDGIFTARASETDWLDKGGWRQFFPDIWQEYAQTVPADRQGDPTAFHVEKALGNNSSKAKKSSYEYLKMELALLKLDDRYQPPNYEDFNPSGGKIELHYLSQGCFMDENYILENAHKIKATVKIVQGRFDMVCPPVTAQELHDKLPSSELVWTINGHARQHEAKNIQKLFIKQLAEAK